MPRPYWSGQAQISLVSFGIQLFPATEAASGIAFHEIDRNTGGRIHHRNISENQEPVDRAEIVKGYEFEKGKYVTIEPAELASRRLESKHIFQIVQFVDVAEIDFRFFEKAYFVVPKNEPQTAAFAVIRRALQETGKAGLGEIAFGGREHLVALMAPSDTKLKGLMAYTLHYATELRDPSESFSEIKSEAVDAGQLALAKDLIERSSSKFDPSKFVDDYEAAVRELIDAKLKHKRLPAAAAAPKRGKVINLMDALRRSLESNGARNKSAGQREHNSASVKQKHKRQGPALVKSSPRDHKTA